MFQDERLLTVSNILTFARMLLAPIIFFGITHQAWSPVFVLLIIPSIPPVTVIVHSTFVASASPVFLITALAPRPNPELIVILRSGEIGPSPISEM